MFTVVLPQNSEMLMTENQYGMPRGTEISLEAGTVLEVINKLPTHFLISVDFEERRIFGRIGADFGNFLEENYTLDDEDETDEIVVPLEMFEE